MQVRLRFIEKKEKVGQQAEQEEDCILLDRAVYRGVG